MSEVETKYSEYLENLKTKFNSFVMEAESGKNNKSSALRARKLSMQLRSDLKDFRTVSTENDKAHTRPRKAAEEAPVAE